MAIRQDAFSDVTDEKYVPTVQSVICHKHNASVGQPCHKFQSIISDRIIEGVCNKRALFAGMRGTINPRSLTVRRGSSA